MSKLKKITESMEELNARQLRNNTPITVAEILAEAERVWVAEGFSYTKERKALWCGGFATGMSEAVKRLDSFGMSDDEIRYALGMLLP